MTDFEQKEAELLAEWNKDNFGLKGQLHKLRLEYVEAQGILNSLQKDHPYYDRHVSHVDGLITRIKELENKLVESE